jgi:hypothetical protein
MKYYASWFIFNLLTKKHIQYMFTIYSVHKLWVDLCDKKSLTGAMTLQAQQQVLLYTSPMPPINCPFLAQVTRPPPAPVLPLMTTHETYFITESKNDIHVTGSRLDPEQEELQCGKL